MRFTLLAKPKWGSYASCTFYLSPFVSQTRFIILSPFVFSFHNKCVLNTFPVIVRVCVSASIVSVLNITAMFVQ